ncbi:MAG: hypothetical protein ABR878_08535 [Roseiarcus sp.]|jgi:hypothetical protein
MIRAVATFAFLVLAAAASAEPLTLASKYDAVGTNPDGSKYQGTATVQILSDTTFAIQWLINGSTYKGFGMRRNDALAATYTIDGEPGLVIYRVDGDGLDGVWAIRGESGNGTEHLTPRQ